MIDTRTGNRMRVVRDTCPGAYGMRMARSRSVVMHLIVAGWMMGTSAI